MPRHRPSRPAIPDGFVLVFALSLSPLFDAWMDSRGGWRRGPQCRTARPGDARFAAEPSAFEALLGGARSGREIRQRGGRVHASRSNEPLRENVVNRQTDLYIYLSTIADCPPRAPLFGGRRATRLAEGFASDVPVNCRIPGRCGQKGQKPNLAGPRPPPAEMLAVKDREGTWESGSKENRPRITFSKRGIAPRSLGGEWHYGSVHWVCVSHR
jgi:hypothetical protein